MAKQWKRVLLAGAAVFLLIQLLPYGRNHINPSVRLEPLWDSPVTRALAKRACFNCHSNETAWPWYASIAPGSWLVYHDVTAGRKTLNFSHWQAGKRAGEDAAAVAHQINTGAMPPFRYVLVHSEAKLSAAEKKQLLDGLQSTFNRSVLRITQ
ncbi:MAG: hypothetical protein H6Q56_1615 [Deltaproteobacteria bacterium]|nr:hypothetical protein [Deltaproteobacteria bacterium]